MKLRRLFIAGLLAATAAVAVFSMTAASAVRPVNSCSAACARMGVRPADPSATRALPILPSLTVNCTPTDALGKAGAERLKAQ